MKPQKCFCVPQKFLHCCIALKILNIAQLCPKYDRNLSIKNLCIFDDETFLVLNGVLSPKANQHELIIKLKLPVFCVEFSTIFLTFLCCCCVHKIFSIFAILFFASVLLIKQNYKKFA